MRISSTWLLVLVTCVGLAACRPTSSAHEDDDGGPRVREDGGDVDPSDGGVDSGSQEPGVWVDVAFYRARSCALLSNGRAVCSGELAASELPPASERFRSISVGPYDVCGVRADGSLKCWHGSVGIDSQEPSGQFTRVAVGLGHACAINAAGQVQCWGETGYNQQGIAGSTGTFSRLAAGGYATCGVKTTGEILCTGDNNGGILITGSSLAYKDVTMTGEGTCAVVSNPGQSPDGYADCSENLLMAVPYDFTTKRFQTIALGGPFGSPYICGITTSGTLSCGDESGYYSFGTPPSGTFKRLAVGSEQACAIRADDALVCWSAQGVVEVPVPSP